jgi:hypothetical protein
MSDETFGEVPQEEKRPAKRDRQYFLLYSGGGIVNVAGVGPVEKGKKYPVTADVAAGFDNEDSRALGWKVIVE